MAVDYAQYTDYDSHGDYIDWDQYCWADVKTKDYAAGIPDTRTYTYTITYDNNTTSSGIWLDPESGELYSCPLDPTPWEKLRDRVNRWRHRVAAAE